MAQRDDETASEDTQDQAAAPAQQEGRGEESDRSNEELEAWPWEEGDELDPELMELGKGSARRSVLRPVLMIGVLVMGSLILSDWREELSYFFSSSEPIQLGSVTDFPSRASEEEEGWSPELPHNRYVELQGIPTRRTLSKRYRYFKLIGGEIYVEALRDDADLSELERIEKGDPRADMDRSLYHGRGRALSFAAMPERYTTLRQYYSRNYNVTFCVDLDAQARAQIERKRRETIQQMWRKRYEEATAQERQAKGLSEEPTQAQIDELMASNPVCVDAWLIQDGRAPRDHWWHLVLASLFGLFMLVDAVFLVRWVMDFLRPDDL